MNRRYRKTIIAGNWKMNKTPSETKAFAEQFKAILPKTKWCDIVVCVPAADLSAAVRAFKDSRIAVGAQNVYFEKSGAYTGEISADMLLELGVEYVVIGHSERRQYFGETDETVNKRTLTAIAKGLIPIVCIGETLEERESGKTEEVLHRQIVEGLKGVEDLTKLVVAYEPVWAIGTGKTATAEQANETIGYIRKTAFAALIALPLENFCADCAAKVRIQYGGSMKGSNAKELMAQPEIDGGLIGGASLKAQDFARVVNFEEK